MNKLLFLLVLTFAGSALIAQPPAGPANKGMTFGQKTDTADVISVDELAVKINDKEVAVKVRGKVVEVCAMEGCWLKMQTTDGKLMVKMKDHSFTVPLEINGKDVVVEGLAVMKVTPVSELKHYAEDAGKSKEDIAAIQQPKKEIILNANGVLVL